MKLFDFRPSGNGYKVRLLLSHLGIAYDYVPVDILKGESRSPAFLAKNPNGRIPVLELDDGTHLCESNAILFFLAQGSAYWPSAALEQSQALQWMFFEQYSHEPNIATLRFWLSIQKIEPTPVYRELIARKTQEGLAALTVMERHLDENDYFVGGQYSIADIALYAYTHVAHEGGFELAAFPAIRRWLARVQAQPRHVSMA